MVHSVGRMDQSGASLGGVLNFGGSFGSAGTCSVSEGFPVPKRRRGRRDLRAGKSACSKQRGNLGTTGSDPLLIISKLRPKPQGDLFFSVLY